MERKIKLTKDIFTIDSGMWCREIENFIRRKLSDSGREGIVVAISGGLDSSVVAALCVRAVGRDKVKGLMLPERYGNPEADYYGTLIADHLGIKIEKINISPILKGLGTSNLLLTMMTSKNIWFRAGRKIIRKIKKSSLNMFKGSYEDILKGASDPATRKLMAIINSKHRARALATYKYADYNNLLIVGSSHKTERMVGLFVKYGIDDCTDIMPMKNIYRSHIVQLAEYLNIPAQILNRPPNPDILPGISDKYKGCLNTESLQLDLILYGLEKGMTSEEITYQLNINEETVTRIQNIVQLSEAVKNHSFAPVLDY